MGNIDDFSIPMNGNVFYLSGIVGLKSLEGNKKSTKMRFEVDKSAGFKTACKLQGEGSS